MSLHSLNLPDGVLARPVFQEEVRIVRPGPPCRAWIVNQQTGSRSQVLPTHVHDLPMLVLGMDQGSVGCAGMAFADHMQSMIHVKFDKFHRVVRDIKLAYTHACGGIFLKAQVYSSYIWSTNNKPFGTGLFGTEKKWLLNTFLATQDTGSEIWKKYGPLIAEDYQMPWGTPEQEVAVWQRLCSLRSHTRGLETVKLGRWFSWNATASQLLSEFHASQMLLEAHLDNHGQDQAEGEDFDDLQRAAAPAASRSDLIAKVKQAGGGLSLTYRLMSSRLLETLQIMYVATQACWSWYTNEVKTVKTPRQGLLRALAASQGKWAQDRHLRATVSTLCDQHALASVFGRSTADAARCAERLLSLTLHILSHRTWSLAVRSVSGSRLKMRALYALTLPSCA